MFLIDLPHCNCITMRDTPSSRRPCVFACLIAASIVNFCYLLCSSARRVLLIGNAKCMARSQLLLSNGLTACPSVRLSVRMSLRPFGSFLLFPLSTESHTLHCLAFGLCSVAWSFNQFVSISHFSSVLSVGGSDVRSRERWPKWVGLCSWTRKS